MHDNESATFRPAQYLRRLEADPRILRVAVHLLAVAAAVALWMLGLSEVDLGDLTGIGLISVLPWTALAGMGLLGVSFAFALRAGRPATQLLLLHVAVLIVMLYGMPAFIEQAPRFNVAWRHVGIAEVLERTGRIDPSIDAYFSWPGFFSMSTLLKEATGVGSLLDFVAWAPVAVNALTLGPLVLLLRAATSDDTVVWVSVWLFYLMNWIGQDYYAPQAYGYIIYLTILALVLTYFGREARPMLPIARRFFRGRMAGPRPALGPAQAAGLLAILVLLFTALTASHQLSPFAVLGALLVLAFLRRITTTGLPAVMLVILAAWLSYMTVAYMEGHIHELIARIGSVDTTVSTNVTERFRGSSEHLVVVVVRSLTSVGLWSLAAVGAVRQLMSPKRDMTWAVLAGAPFTLLLLQSYGGEILLRVYLFGLPFMCLLATSALLAARRRSGAQAVIVVIVLSAICMGSVLVARYGNEKMDMATAAEADGMAALYELAPPDSQLVALADNVFWKYRDYELYHYRTVTEEVLDSDAAAIVAMMRQRANSAGYLIISRAQLAALELQFGISSNTFDGIEASVARTPGVRRVYRNEDVTIYRSDPRGPE